MILFLSVCYGLHLVLLLYGVAWITARGMIRGGSVFSVLIVLLKYLIYWKVVQFGFHHFSHQGILWGLIVGLYVSLPLLYVYNRWLNRDLK